MKLKSLFLLFFVVVLISGCVSIDKPVASDVSFPPDGRYETLGTVTYIEKTKIFFGLFSKGGARYGDLLWTAKVRFKADDVVNITSDVNVFSFFGIYSVVEYTLRGTAIRYLPATAPAE